MKSETFSISGGLFGGLLSLTLSSAEKYNYQVFKVFLVAAALTRCSEVSRVDVDLDSGSVTGYSERVAFLSTPTATPGDAGRRCGRQAVIRVELGGSIQVSAMRRTSDVWILEGGDEMEMICAFRA